MHKIRSIKDLNNLEINNLYYLSLDYRTSISFYLIERTPSDDPIVLTGNYCSTSTIVGLNIERIKNEVIRLAARRALPHGFMYLDRPITIPMTLYRLPRSLRTLYFNLKRKG